MKFKLPYGKTDLLVDLSDEFDIDIVEPKWISAVEDMASAITNALQNPIGCKPLKELLKPSDKVAIIFSDITRATPYKIILPPLLAELKYVQQDNIRFFCSNGTHRLATKKELTSILGKSIVENYTVIQNDVRNCDSFKYVGTTASGNRISLNKEILTNDLIILTGFIEPHFFAGFSGGGKAIVPGDRKSVV